MAGLGSAGVVGSGWPRTPGGERIRRALPAAPGYVLPADRKWYRDWALAHPPRETFDTLQLGYPPAGFDVRHERERLLGPESSP